MAKKGYTMKGVNMMMKIEETARYNDKMIKKERAEAKRKRDNFSFQLLK